ncbi:flagellar assembly peptidoglycan hydrolase FlgJ [Congregibacter litoralis]|uniref:Peptidoglycan hydrolase FlgJ n=1 Tax=Congregibacter litoralis KT71 TaxID=314285 RepID=A4A610_9GAMM|nr:flagellar assembly peptidoglycan hydrolase FlgJ [Congregibacter litoralis]EAQ98457.1 flagellar rod assembly protein/muramidase FlgJ [Congregibacter litoralis KT71]
MQPQAVYNDFNSLANLRTAARQDADASLRDVAQQFESLFVQMMLKSMRDATMEGGLFDSHQLESYQQMHDQQLSLDLASRGGIGLADVLVEQLRSDRAGLSPDDGDGAALHMPGAAPENKLQPLDLERYLKFPISSQRFAPAATSEASPVTPPWAPASPREFADRLRPLAEEAARELGVDADVLLAQAALETGWGKHVTTGAQGSSHNFFNIKAGADWDGATVTVQTMEYRDGVAVREVARFRAYESAADSFADYAALIKGSPRYSDARELAADGEQYLRELQRAGYATDPAYADKVLSILKRGDLAGAAPDLKNAATLPLTG